MAAGDIFNDLDKRQEEDFWPTLGRITEEEGNTGIELVVDASSCWLKARQDIKEVIVVSKMVSTAKGELEKRSIVLEVPSGKTYNVDDFLTALTINDSKSICRGLEKIHSFVGPSALDQECLKHQSHSIMWS